MGMRRLSIKPWLLRLLPLAPFTLPTASAKDLPDVVRVQNVTHAVEISDVLDARIKKQGYSSRSASSNPTLRALVEIKVAVQGNICSDSPESLSVQFVAQEDSSSPEYNVRLSTSGNYKPDPWGALQGCLAYSKRSEVIIPVAFEWSDYEGSSRSTSYAFRTQNEQQVRVILEVTEGNGGRKKLALFIE
jgi:hypothetical protein